MMNSKGDFPLNLDEYLLYTYTIAPTWKMSNNEIFYLTILTCPENVTRLSGPS